MGRPKAEGLDSGHVTLNRRHKSMAHNYEYSAHRLHIGHGLELGLYRT